MSLDDDLQAPVSGSCYAHLFENPRVGVKRDLYWSFTVTFGRTEVDGTPIEPSMTVEWVRAGVRDWRSLPGLQIGTSALDEHAEASLTSWSTFRRSPWISRCASAARINIGCGSPGKWIATACFARPRQRGSGSRG